MRFELEPDKPPPRTRVQTWFAWLPVIIGLECRWLETVTAEQELREWTSEDTGRTYYSYESVRFVR